MPLTITMCQALSQSGLSLSAPLNFADPSSEELGAALILDDWDQIEEEPYSNVERESRGDDHAALLYEP